MKFSLFLIFTLLAASGLRAQETFYNRQDWSYQLLQRYEIESGSLWNNIFFDAGPVSRYEANVFFLNLNKPRGKYQADYIKADNLPYTAHDSLTRSRKPILKYFYQTRANLFEQHLKDFDLFINPVLGFYGGKERGTYSHNLIRNSRGFEVRGNVDGKVGFYSYLTDNQVFFPSYVNEYADSNQALPGEGYHKTFKKTGWDFYTARAYVTFKATDHIHFQFGTDKHFIGSGYRSLLLSDFGPDFLSLKIRTRIWRFEYDNIFGQFINYINNLPKPYPKKYGSFHYLTFDAARFLNFGIFEGVMFNDVKNEGRGFELTYLNPVIFYNTAEASLGSGDNSLVGLNLNILPVHNFLFYGQIMIDELKVHEVFNSRGWIGNKQGIQAGFKWLNLFGLPNIDWQSEANAVRPFTYTHDSSGSNYVHYNQPLAHPAGANFFEWINLLKINSYAPLQIELKYIYLLQGLDSTAGFNQGENILHSYKYKIHSEYGYHFLEGVLTTTSLAGFSVSYQIRHNLFVDLDLLYRMKKNYETHTENMIVNAGLRLNFTKPIYDF